MNTADNLTDSRRNRKEQVEKFQREHQKPIHTLRRVNLQALAEIHGAKKLSAMLGYRQPSFLSQMLGNGWNRVVSEKSAREFEQSLKLPDGFLDKPLFPAPTDAGVAVDLDDTPLADVQALSIALIAQTIKDVNRILQTEKVNITIDQFSKLLAIEVVDASENGFKVRESHVKQMLEMIK